LGFLLFFLQQSQKSCTSLYAHAIGADNLVIGLIAAFSPLAGINI